MITHAALIRTRFTSGWIRLLATLRYSWYGLPAYWPLHKRTAQEQHLPARGKLNTIMGYCDLQQCRMINRTELAVHRYQKLALLNASETTKYWQAA